MEQFNNKYRIASARASWWDYGNAGAYFITICTKNREHFFGEINDGKMILSPTGVIADILWHEIPNHANNVELDEFVVMPNHIHGILILHGDNWEMDENNNDENVVSVPTVVETRHALSLPPIDLPIDFPNETDRDLINNLNNHPRFRNPGKNTVSSIIGGYKSAVTKHANRLGLPHGWQSRFHDHIIRDATEYERIKNYISNNISNWKNDKFY